MKVAIIDPVGKKAGMDCYDIPLAIAISEKEFEAVVFSNFYDDGIAASNNVEVLPVFGMKRFNTLLGVVGFLTGLLRAIVGCKKQKIKWVILHQFNSNSLTAFKYLILKASGFNIVSILHDVTSFNGDDTKIGKRIINGFCSDLICIQNDVIESKVRKEFGKKVCDKLFVAPHGSYLNVITKDSSKSESRALLDIPVDKFVILFFGQIKKNKGLETLLRAMPSISSEVYLIVAGQPWNENINHYTALASNLGIGSRVKFDIRYISNSDRDLYFTAVDALVLPYTEIYESGVMLMAMSFGLPIYASDLPLFRQRILDTGSGVLFKTNDHTDLGNVIQHSYLESDSLEKMGANGLNLVESEYSWSYVAEKYRGEISLFADRHG